MDSSERLKKIGESSDLHEVRRQMANSYTLLRSIIRRSAESATSLESYAWHLEGRIDVIGRVLSAVMRDPRVRFDLRQLIADELHDQGAGDGPHAWSLEGPAVKIGAAAAEVLALLFHELITNSVEHGVLGMAERGELRVVWWIEEGDGEGRLRLDWTERGAPAVLAREGFGTMVLEGMLRYQLEGAATRRLGPEGVQISLTLPMRCLAQEEAAVAER